MIARQLLASVLLVSSWSVACKDTGTGRMERPVSARDASGVDASLSDAGAAGNPSCPKGTTFGSPARSSSMPKGGCNSRFAECTFISSDPCPGQTYNGPHIEWTCTCTDGNVDCSGRPLDKSICPPVRDARASD
jgi:hypothetical protein